MKAGDKTLIHLGCGRVCPEGSWTHFDGSFGVLFNRFPRIVFRAVTAILPTRGSYRFPDNVGYLNLERPLPFGNASVDAFYASHVLEHLYLDTAKALLVECFRCLRVGGIIRIAVPNLQNMVDIYQRNRKTKADAAELLQQGLGLRDFSKPRSIVKRVLTAIADQHSHKFMYDEAALINLLVQARFTEVSTRSYLDSSIPEIAEIEQEQRVALPWAFVVEASRPSADVPQAE